MEKYLAIDIGGTFIKYSLMDETARILEEGSVPTRQEPEAFRKQLLAVAEGYRGQIKGIGACMAGFINPQTGENTDYSVGEKFRAFNIREELEKALEVTVTLENDSNCALLGEVRAGAARECKNVLLYTIGTGIGGAILWDGKLCRGSHYKAGEAGFMKSGEREAGATSQLVREVGKMLGKEVDGHYVFQNLQDKAIKEIYEEWLKRLACAVGNGAVLCDPEVVLIGGGICRQERFIEDLRNRVYMDFPHLEEYTKIKACAAGNQAGRIGAFYLLMEQLGKP